MRINISADIVNGIYNFVEAALIILLLSFLRTTISWNNLKTVYDGRKPLQLKRTRLSILCDPGLAPLNVGRVAVLLATVVVVLTVTGGLGIVGKTEPVYEYV